MTVTPSTYLEHIRNAEFDHARREFGPRDRVLEIGGGSGFQAALLAECVRECVSIDVKLHPQPVFPVTVYDGKTLPFEESSFDIIFSSNVLEHVSDLDSLLGECSRVLKPGGVMVHIVPSSWWRIWTTVSYYPALPKILMSNLRNLRELDASAVESRSPPKGAKVEGQKRQGRNSSGLMAIIRRHFKLKWIRTILISPRHGERGNEITEIFYFKASWWRNLFERNGWRVMDERPCQLFYSGNGLFGSLLNIRIRRILCRFLGSSTYLYKVSRRRL